MSWVPWWVWTLLGVVAYVLVGWRPVFRAWRNDFAPLSWGDLIMGIVVAAVMGIAGPFFLICQLDSSKGTPDRLGRALAGEPSSERRQRKERELQERERHIRRLEQELGIK